ncbi:M20 family metallopeptidase [Oscillibacter sp. GMB15532]|uniref:M20 metallopeptidase family protein n=1 Tax=Oscillibacter sp. GMB15532 TaxID=3230022 RepID=UPI0034DDFF3D
MNVNEIKPANLEFEETLKERFKWFHRHPELALEEHETTRKIKELLVKIEGVELLELGLPTGALARIAGNAPGPVIAIRADIDALPITEASELAYSSENAGRMHACGHDFHTTALLGAAALLAAQRESLPGTVLLLFQPAEEAEHGGEKVVQTGIFKTYGIQRILALHVRSKMPVGTIGISGGPFSAAVDRFVIRISGKGCHGSAPQDGLDPIPAAARLIGSFQEIVSRGISPRESAVVSITRVTSGTSWNIIPDSAELEGTVRSFDPSVREAVVHSMEKKLNALQAEGYQTGFQWLPGCPATNNDGDLADLIAQTALNNGFAVVPQRPEMGGEDFSCYQELIPGALFHVGIGDTCPLHNAGFSADLSALAPAAGLMARIAVETIAKEKEG